MKPAPFDYYAPTSVDETCSLLAQYGGDAKLLAGGQSLVPLLALRLAQPAVLIDLNGVRELNYVHANGDGLDQDHGEAVKWLKAAAEQGHAPAQLQLGVTFEMGQGVSRNNTEAAKWFRLAADKGDPIQSYATIAHERITDRKVIAGNGRAAAEPGLVRSSAWSKVLMGYIATSLIAVIKKLVEPTGGFDAVTLLGF